MALDTPHPLYSTFLPDWTQMRDTFEGERCVKDAGFRYLPPTSSMVMDGATTLATGLANTTTRGWQQYVAYRARARFHDYVKDAVTYLLGVMHREPPSIELPPKMEYLLERATLAGESLEELLRRVNEQQLITGRVGIMGDVLGPESGEREDEAVLALYRAENILNWDQGLREGVRFRKTQLVVLDESRDERQSDFQWKRVERYRVLALGDPTMPPAEGEVPAGVYQSGEFSESKQFSASAMFEPSYRGNTIDEIPFVFVNACDVVAEPEKPPLLGLSALALAMYRGEADYRQTLYQIGQDTLVVIGGNLDEGEKLRTGAGARIDVETGGDAKYIGINSQGLPEQRMALENDHKMAQQAAGQLLDSTTNERESGEALRVRVGVRTATVKRVALAGAVGVERILRKVAKWIGENPEDVVITPNLDFVDDRMSGAELTDLMGAKVIGVPISLETIHAQMRERGLTDKSFEDEIAEIAQEADLAPQLRREGSTNPDGPDQEEDEGDDGERVAA